jgi:hypothetical protein
MLPNTISHVTDFSHVKQLSDQVVACGETVLGFEEYLKLLLPACFTYDKYHVTPRSDQQCNVFLPLLSMMMQKMVLSLSVLQMYQISFPM